MEQDFDNVVTRGHILTNKLKGTEKNPALDFHDPKDTYPKAHNREAFYHNKCKLCCSLNGHLELHMQTHPGDQHFE